LFICAYTLDESIDDNFNNNDEVRFVFKYTYIYIYMMWWFLDNDNCYAMLAWDVWNGGWS